MAVAGFFKSIHKILTRYPLFEVARTALAQPKLTWAYQRRSLTMPTLPARMMIDPINICNLQCTLCPTGQNTSGMTQRAMPFEMFEHIVNLNPNLRMLDLFNLGEPFLNKDIFRMFELCQKKRIRVSVHTNLEAYDMDMVERIIQSPLARLHISVDGLCQETYGYYRVGGSFDKVWKNMKYLSRRIKETSRGPAVEWGYLYHKRNKQDISEAQKRAQELGFKFYARPLVIVPQERGPEWHDSGTIANEPISFRSDVVCPHLWLQMTLRPTGQLAYCCFAYHDDDALSEPLTSISTPEQLLELWNSGRVKRGRACFRKGTSFREIKNPMLCETCNIYPRTGGLDPEKHPYDMTFRDWLK
ncbi:radical SAM protein [candidate division KSB1 bacterium]|nr:radical SAM protein [candidate division KSB1 bacterium]